MVRGPDTGVAEDRLLVRGSGLWLRGVFALALGALFSAAEASTPPRAIPPGFDSAIDAAEALVILDGPGSLEPCGLEPYPAILRAQVREVWRGGGRLREGAFLVSRAAATWGGERALVALRWSEAGEGHGCAQRPGLALALPPIALAGREEALRAYLRARAELPTGSGRPLQEAQLWAGLLEASGPGLAEHGVRALRALVEAGALPAQVRRPLEARAAQAEAEGAPGARAVRVVWPWLEPPRQVALLLADREPLALAALKAARRQPRPAQVALAGALAQSPALEARLRTPGPVGEGLRALLRGGGVRLSPAGVERPPASTGPEGARGGAEELGGPRLLFVFAGLVALLAMFLLPRLYRPRGPTRSVEG